MGCSQSKSPPAAAPAAAPDPVMERRLDDTDREAERQQLEQSLEDLQKQLQKLKVEARASRHVVRPDAISDASAAEIKKLTDQLASAEAETRTLKSEKQRLEDRLNKAEGKMQQLKDLLAEAEAATNAVIGDKSVEELLELSKRLGTDSGSVQKELLKRFEDKISRTHKLVAEAAHHGVSDTDDSTAPSDRLSMLEEQVRGFLLANPIEDNSEDMRKAWYELRSVPQGLLRGIQHTFKFVSAQKLLKWKVGPLPKYQDLPDCLGKGCWEDFTISFHHVVTRENWMEKLLAVSHRWSEESHADKDGSQLKVLKGYLKDHPEIEWVWMDFWSLPQRDGQRERNRQEDALFKDSLKNMYLLYLGLRVLIIADMQYVGRFWTSYEAFLSTRAVTPKGLQVAPEHSRRCEIRVTGAAEEEAGDLKQMILATWGKCTTAAEAHSKLAKDDIRVTNKNDKEEQLIVLQKLDTTVTFFLTLLKQAETQVLTASGDKTAKIWSTATGQCTQTFEGHGKEVYSAIFSADGSYVLTASWETTARIWSTATGRCIHTFEGHQDYVVSAVFSGDVRSVLTASWDKTAKLWCTATEECTLTFSGHLDKLDSAVFSADGTSVLTASWDKTAKIYCTAKGYCTQTFSGHHKRVVSAVFSADGKSALTASWDRMAKIWNTATGECAQTISAFQSRLTSAVFSPDGRSVLIASYDATATIFCIANWERTQTFSGHQKCVDSAVFSADGASVLTASEDKTAKIWSTATGQCLQTFSGHLADVKSAVFFQRGGHERFLPEPISSQTSTTDD